MYTAEECDSEIEIQVWGPWDTFILVMIDTYANEGTYLKLAHEWSKGRMRVKQGIMKTSSSYFTIYHIFSKTPQTETKKNRDCKGHKRLI